jgi:hypothetical protein
MSNRDCTDAGREVEAPSAWAETRWVDADFAIHIGRVLDEGERGTRSGEVRGPFAIHDADFDQPIYRMPSGRWVLTHLPTGGAMHAFPKRAAAKRAVEEIVRQTGVEPWEKLYAAGAAIPDELRQAARRAILTHDRPGALERWPHLADASPIELPKSLSKRSLK